MLEGARRPRDADGLYLQPGWQLHLHGAGSRLRGSGHQRPADAHELRHAVCRGRVDAQRRERRPGRSLHRPCRHVDGDSVDSRGRYGDHSRRRPVHEHVPGHRQRHLQRCGDAGVPAGGYFIRPTVFTSVQRDMGVFRDEIFGPVLAVSEFDSLDEALEVANDSIYGLSSAIYTTDIRAARRYIDGIEAGLAHVNVHTGYKEPSMPFGGVKQSGAGLPENSESGLEAFVDRKAVYLRG